MSDCISFTAYSKLSEKCQKCEFKDECEQKQKELLGEFTAIEPAIQPAILPSLQPTQPILYDERQREKDNFKRYMQKMMKGE